MKKIKLGAFLLCALAATVSQSEAKDVFMLPEVVVTATHTENTLEKSTGNDASYYTKRY